MLNKIMIKESFKCSVRVCSKIEKSGGGGAYFRDGMIDHFWCL